MIVRPLVPDDALALIALRRTALVTEPLAFASSPDDDARVASEPAMRAALADVDATAVVGAFDGDDLVGIVGLTRELRHKARHRVHIWGVYVAPAYRGAGVGAAIMAAAVERARAWPGVLQVDLAVTDAAEAAARLYRRAGFDEWGYQPRTVCHEGVCVGQRHFLLALEPAGVRESV